MVVAPAVDQKTGKAVASIDRTFQEARENALVLINDIQNYLEKKYKCNIKSILAGRRAMGAGGEYLDVPACNIGITYVSGDLQVLDFLAQARVLSRTLGALEVQIKGLPESADSVVDAAVIAQNQAKSLMSFCDTELQPMADEIGKIGNLLMVIATDMISIQQFAKELVSSLSPV